MSLNISFFHQLMERFSLSHVSKLAVAVSGGADSLCLTLLLHQYTQDKGIELVALTVDHKIREESTQEALAVGAFLKSKGIQHKILTNTHVFSDARIEEEARNIRYELLTEFCVKNQIEHLFVAHHQSDQIETMLSRLARGSGLDGLCSMRFVFQRNGVYICRPFLEVSKQSIVQYLKKNMVEWVEDPMNYDASYERVKWRQFLPVLEKNGLKSKYLSLSLSRLDRAREALDFYTQQFLASSVSFYKEGYALINTQAFELLPCEIQMRVLMSLIKKIGGSSKFLSMEAVEKLLVRFPVKTTLGCCVFVPHKRGIFVAKESSKMQKEKTLDAKKTVAWDRFLISSEVEVVVKAGSPRKRIKNIPYEVLKSWPNFCLKKPLEKSEEIDYKDWTKYGINVQLNLED